MWFACWLFTWDLCSCVAVLAVGCVRCTAVLLCYFDAPAHIIAEAKLNYYLSFAFWCRFSFFTAELLVVVNRLQIVAFVRTEKSNRNTFVPATN